MTDEQFSRLIESLESIYSGITRDDSADLKMVVEAIASNTNELHRIANILAGHLGEFKK